MAEKTLHSLKSNATRLGQRLGENLAGEYRVGAGWVRSLGNSRELGAPGVGTVGGSGGGWSSA